MRPLVGLEVRTLRILLLAPAVLALMYPPLRVRRVVRPRVVLGRRRRRRRLSRHHGNEPGYTLRPNFDYGVPRHGADPEAAQLHLQQTIPL